MKRFYSSIGQGVEALHRRLAVGEVGFMSAAFVQQAAALVRSVHAQLLEVVGRLHLPAGERWLDEYMDETSRLWDACLLVRAGASALHAYSAAAAHAIHHLYDHDDDYIHAARAINAPRRHAAGLLQDNRALLHDNIHDPASLLLLDHRSPRDLNLNAFNGFRALLYALRNATSFLLAILLSATVSSCLPDHLISTCTPLPLPTAPGYASSMARLRHRVAQEMRALAAPAAADGILMYEFRQARAAIDSLKADLDRVVATGTGYAHREDMAERAHLVKGCLAMLGSGAEAVIAELDDLFDDIVEGRKMLSDLCSHR
uniref:Uncharacterized protein n=1 Tax=Oryza glumipatula TaxID=40148 RepID=A0A0E0APW6_9ORYZ